MDEEDCGKRYLCELGAGDQLDSEEQLTLSFFQVFTPVRRKRKFNMGLGVAQWLAHLPTNW